MRDWWHGLAAGERRMLLVGAPLAVLLLGWAFVWHPLAQRRAVLRQDVALRASELAYVERGAAEVERLRATGVRSRADRAGRSLLALADATARGAGLEAALRRVEPAGGHGVRVVFENARFDALAAWLEELSRGYGVEASDLSADRADGVGLVNARVTLQDAP
jgi:general secretion pathway protein M